MEEQFIPYELALKLKELGFDEECFGWWSYINGTTAHYYNYICTNTKLIDLNTFPKNCSAPLWQQAFDFFREVHGLYYSIVDNCEYWVGEKIEGFPTGTSNSYEEAQLECLKKLIEILEEKNNND